MEFINLHLLTLILFFPVLAAVVVLCLPKDALKAIRWTAFGMSLVPFLLTIVLWMILGKKDFVFDLSSPAIGYYAKTAELFLLGFLWLDRDRE